MPNGGTRPVKRCKCHLMASLEVLRRSSKGRIQSCEGSNGGRFGSFELGCHVETK